MNHEDWQKQVSQLARVFGWEVLHVRKSIGKGRKWTTPTSVVGWPDLFLWHPTRGFAAIELKVGRDVATPEQLRVLDTLNHAGAMAMVAYPEDFEAVRAMLERGLVATPLPAVAS